MAHYVKIVILSSIFLTSADVVKEKRQVNRRFPDDFEFGVSTASYQIEGGWSEDGKSWSIWDHLVRTSPDHIADNTNGDVAASSFHLYPRDVEMMKELGVHNYRFSISWTRILPSGRPDFVNPAGIAYYNNLINLLLENGITPFPTIYHWDLPQTLSEKGGLLSEDFPEWFADYARVLFQNFGDRIQHWMTINEPFIHCYLGYGTGSHAPRIQSPGVGFYECGRHILLANAKAYHIYDEEFRASQGGQIGIVLSMDWPYPSTDSQDDADAVDAYFAFEFGQYMDPIFTPQGNYPQLLIDRVAAASEAQGFNSSRLRPFTEDQINYIRGTSDFLALNHYTSDMVYRNDTVAKMHPVPSFLNDGMLATYKDPSWPTSASLWLRENAPGFYNLLSYIRENYNSPAIYVTENGFSTSPETGLVDDDRVRYLRNYLSALQDAIAEGVNVKGYFAWSLMDNFEWAMGYTQRFGLYHVDIEDPNRTRTAKKSALMYKDIIRSRVIDYEFNPDPTAVDSDSAFICGASLVGIVTVAILNIILSRDFFIVVIMSR